MAPPLLTLKDAQLAIGERKLLAGLELKLDAAARVALVGRNGAGKSTLLQVLAGRVELDAGSLTRAPRTRLAYLPQAPAFDGVADARTWLVRADEDAPEGLPPYTADALLEEFELDGAADPRTLSGGQRRRLALARTLALDVDALLLDEPTNHLDLDTIVNLETRLRAFRGAVVLISHDRAFLDAVATRCWWLDRGRILDLEVPFHDLEPAIAAELEREQREAAKLDKRIAEETRWSREGITARRKRNQGRLRRLEAMRRERAQRVRPEGAAPLAAEAAPASGALVVEAEGITKAFDGETVVPPFSTRILRGDRVGVVGPNGAGKSTLLKLLTGELAPDDGRLKLGTKLEIAWYEQERENLDLAKTPWEVLCPEGGDQVAVGGRPRHVMGYLKDFLFDESQARSPCRALSGGERNRLLLAKLFARPSNLMVLDEPTNDLDMDTLDVLGDAIADYAGTLLVVSHDRDFLDRTVTSTIAFEPDGSVVEYAGGYGDMLRQRAATGGPTAPAAKPKAKGTGGKDFTTPAKEQRRRERDAARAEREVERLHGEIRAIEERLADGTLFAREPERAKALAAQLEALRGEAEAAEARWLELAEAAEG
ncbi:MAG: ATP-binding cassette domain-containing protein [Alphaproteobacteria bacterium]|jgi:ATP-binding cassette subfamily F protein uup|nr:ATP-binding cassette domain-containing protein [Alphaproteobacteria bacterium]